MKNLMRGKHSKAFIYEEADNKKAEEEAKKIKGQNFINQSDSSSDDE